MELNPDMMEVFLLVGGPYDCRVAIPFRGLDPAITLDAQEMSVPQSTFHHSGLGCQMQSPGNKLLDHSYLCPSNIQT